MGQYRIGIDLGGTNIAVGIVDESHHLVSSLHTPTRAERSFDAIIADMASTAHSAVQQAGLSLSDITHVGIGVPSSIHPDSHHVLLADNLGWVDRDIAAPFRALFDVPVFIGNDADCAAYAEVLVGAVQSYHDVLMLTLGTGVGGALILNNEIYTGGNRFGCELGHVTLVADGRPCPCGRNGCLEAYASATALIQDGASAMLKKTTGLLYAHAQGNPDNVTGRLIFESAQQGDTAAQEVVDQFIHFLAVGISSFVTMLRPQAILIGGGLSNQGEALLVPLRAAVLAHAYAVETTPQTPIFCATLGNDAGIIGAAALTR